MSRLLLLVAVLALSASLVAADVYLHHPRGSNDRLNEPGRERQNGNRLFDSQNNNRGGYSVGSVQRIYYYEGTVVPIEWTQQHSCGDSNGNNCEIILQYSCGDSHIRDGTTLGTIPEVTDDCVDGDCDKDMRFGRHESYASWMSCRHRMRNRGLFVANQNLENRNAARNTRQNNNGNRNGYECPEERDYYPYWAPTMWRDIAVITNNPSRCPAFKAASANVSPRSYCSYDATNPIIAKYIADNRQGWVPITKDDCEKPVNKATWPAGAVWTTVPAFGIPEPDCVVAPFTRDNHLGNAIGQKALNGYPSTYNWTVPAGIDSPNCVLRLRYNISTQEMGPSQGFKSATELGVYRDVNSGVTLDSKANMQKVIPQQDNNARIPSLWPIWAEYGIARGDNNGSFTKEVQNNNADAAGGIKKAQPPSRDYTLRNNPQVDLFGPLLLSRKDKDTADKDANLNGQPMLRTRLAINTAQFGRTFQDRTHTFEIRRRPESLANTVIHNLSVRGKKGNIVQVYPSVEYDFVPDILEVQQGDFIHIQWTGSTPQDDDNDAGTKNGDRSNIVALGDAVYTEPGQSDNKAKTMGQFGRAYPGLINDTTKAMGGFDFVQLRNLAYAGLFSPHFDIGPVQAKVAGQWHYVGTRNNAFSNRSQKGKLIVLTSAEWQAKSGADKWPVTPVPVGLYGETKSGSGKGLIKTEWAAGAEEMRAAGAVIVPGSVTLDDPQTDGWFRVNPPVLDLGVRKNMGALYVELSREQEGNFFMKGQMSWKLNPEDEAIEVIPLQGFYGAKNRYAIQDGGYYQSKSVPNTGMIAGIVIGVLGIASIVLYLYWKVRVQPEGGWKAFFKKGSSSSHSNYQQGHGETELIPSGAASSSSVQISTQ